MQGTSVPHLEVQVGPVVGSDESERKAETIKLRYDCRPKFAPNLTVADHQAIVDMPRRVADRIEEEHIARRR
jgi:hypothetical protein